LLLVELRPNIRQIIKKSDFELVIECIYVLRGFSCLSKEIKFKKSIPAYLPLERLRVPRPIDRVSFVKETCRGKVVLDLGAMDETAYAAKQGRGTWLHEEIAEVAQQVVGIDSSPLLPPDGLRTGMNSVIRAGNSMELDACLQSIDFVPDVIVAGELIEHLENPLRFLKGVKAIDKLQGKTLILTTPNATAIHNCLIGLLSMESTHQDHLCILSFKTLCTLCLRSGFERWEIVPYFARFTEMKERNVGIRRALVSGGEKAINGLEWLFPMMGFGYIVKVQI
jgi:hypothetical protein